MRSRRRNVAQFRAAVGLAGKIPPEASREDSSDHKGADAGRRLRFEVDAPTSLRSIRFSMVHKPKERQRAQRPGYSALTIGINSASVY